MYVAGVKRDRFLAEIRGGKEIPRVRALHALMPNDRKPGLLLHYEIDAKEPSGEKMRLVYNELFPAKDDRAVDIAGSLLEHLHRDGLTCEIDPRGGAL